MTRGPAPESLPQARETPDAWFGRIFLYRRGRMAAFMMLLLFALLIGIHSLRVAETRDEADTALHLLSRPAAGVQQLLFDAYQRVLPRQRRAQTVAVVGIDENSLKVVGQWPWPRSQLAELIDREAVDEIVLRIHHDRDAVIGDLEDEVVDAAFDARFDLGLPDLS